MNIHFGDLVFVDLSTRAIRRESCPQNVLQSFFGGRGLGVYLLLQHLEKHVQALEPDNPLIFATGLLTGTEMISSSRLHISTLSPLSGLLGSSNVGGDVSNELKRCGIGALIVHGKADAPVLLDIHDDRITFVDASDMWGASTTETYHRLQERHKRTKVLAIGPAGEHQCAFASIMAGFGHFAGRTGTGAVMGSKLLKAISVRATRNPKPSKNRKAVEMVKQYFELARVTEGYRQYSTSGSSLSTFWLDKAGANAVRNFQDVKFHAIDEVSYAARTDVIESVKGCYKCPIKCKAHIKIDSGRHAGRIMERPEFETLLSWGPKCGASDGREVVHLHNLCDEYGIDAIETGNLIAFAMDLFERGIFSPDVTVGLDLYWGNVSAMEALLQEIVFRSTWLGDTLAGGIKHAVTVIGNGAEHHAFAVKGLTITGMDPRGFKATALGYAVGARGSDFTQVYAKPEYKLTPEQALLEYGTEKAADRLAEDGKALMVRKCISSTALVDALGLCKIPQLGCLVDSSVDILGTLLQEILGLELTHDDLLTIGERIISAERLFNYKFGAVQHDDSLPAKFLNEPVPHGDSKGSVVDLELMLREYYTAMQWDEHGNVTPERIQELGLNWAQAPQKNS